MGAGEALAVDEHGEEGCYRQGADGDAGKEDGFREGGGHQKQGEKIEGGAAEAADDGQKQGPFGKAAKIRLLFLEEEEKKDKGGKEDGGEHKKIAMLSVKGHLLIFLNDRAGDVAAEKHHGADEPFEKRFFGGAVFLRLEAEIERADHQGKADADVHGQGGLPEDKAPNGDAEEGKLLDEGGHRDDARSDGLKETEDGHCVKDAVGNGIEQHARIKGGLKGKEDAPAGRGACRNQEIIERRGVKNALVGFVKDGAHYAEHRGKNGG